MAPSVLSNFGKPTAVMPDSHATSASADSWKPSSASTDHQQHSLPPAASSLSTPPGRGILRRNSTNEDSSKSWQHNQDTKPAPTISDASNPTVDKSSVKIVKTDSLQDSLSSPAIKKVCELVLACSSVYIATFSPTLMLQPVMIHDETVFVSFRNRHKSMSSPRTL